MARRNHNLAKRIGIDIAGFGLVILAALTGWLPGPGGIPLLLAGLGILALNYEWAERLHQNITKKGLAFIEKAFPERFGIMRLWDILTILLLLLGAYAIHQKMGITLSILPFALGIGIFTFNRKRAKRFGKWLRRHKK